MSCGIQWFVKHFGHSVSVPESIKVDFALVDTDYECWAVVYFCYKTVAVYFGNATHYYTIILFLKYYYLKYYFRYYFYMFHYAVTSSALRHYFSILSFQYLCSLLPI